MSDLMAIFIGGGLGSLARFGISKWSTSFAILSFPLGTLISNVVASFILGIFLGVTTTRPETQNSLRFLIAIGFCGGFSTFSTFSAETIDLLRYGNISLFVLNIVANMAGCLLMVGAGFWIAKNI